LPVNTIDPVIIAREIPRNSRAVRLLSRKRTAQVPDRHFSLSASSLRRRTASALHPSVRLSQSRLSRSSFGRSDAAPSLARAVRASTTVFGGRFASTAVADVGLSSVSTVALLASVRRHRRAPGARQIRRAGYFGCNSICNFL